MGMVGTSRGWRRRRSPCRHGHDFWGGSRDRYAGSGGGYLGGGHHRRAHDQHRKALMNGTLILLALCQVSAIAQPKFSAPLIGVARDSQKQVRLVHGVAGNFVWREVIGG